MHNEPKRIKEEYIKALPEEERTEKHDKFLENPYTPLLDPLHRKMHPEDHKGFHTINGILNDAQTDLRAIAAEHNNISDSYRKLVLGAREKAAQLEQEYHAFKTRLHEHYLLCSPQTGFTGISTGLPEGTLAVPVVSMAFVSDEDVPYPVEINQESYQLLPFNSEREGIKAAARFGDYEGSDEVILLEEPIRSFHIEPHSNEEILILYGKAVYDV